MMMGTRLLSIFVGPINIWNTTRSVPPIEAISGHYQLSDVTSEDLEKRGIFVSDHSGFTLYPDHKLEVFDLPAFDGFGKPLDCNYRGTGTWALYDSNMDVTLDMSIQAAPIAKGDLPSCPLENAGLMTVLGRSAPYRFWYVIGDPDEDEGTLYKKR